MNRSGSSRYLFSVVRERLRHHPGPVLDFAFGRYHEPLPETIRALVSEQAERERWHRAESHQPGAGAVDLGQQCFLLL